MPRVMQYLSLECLSSLPGAKLRCRMKTKGLPFIPPIPSCNMQRLPRAVRNRVASARSTQASMVYRLWVQSESASKTRHSIARSAATAEGSTGRGVGPLKADALATPAAPWGKSCRHRAGAVRTNAAHRELHAVALVAQGFECLQRVLRCHFKVYGLRHERTRQRAVTVAALAREVRNGVHAGRHGLEATHPGRVYPAQQQADLGETVYEAVQ